MPFCAGEVISVQTLKIKNKLLAPHKENKLTTLLSVDEVNSLNYFTTLRSQASSKVIALGMKSMALYSEAGDADLEAITNKISKL